MTIVSSIRWRDEQLYKQIKKAAKQRGVTFNCLIMSAAAEFLSLHTQENNQSELHRQTAAYMKKEQSDFNLKQWSDGCDTSEWK